MMPQGDNDLVRSGFFSQLGSFLRRLLLAFLKLGLVFIVLVVLVGVAWLIYQEIDRSFDNLSRRMNANTGRIDTAEDDLDTLMAKSAILQEQVLALQTTVASQDTLIVTLESGLIAGYEQQAEDLTALEERVIALVTSTDTISGNLAVLNEGVVALQLDTTTNVSDIDALGGELDAFQADLVTLMGEVEAMQLELSDYSADEFKRMRQALALFRVWEMVSRARLRLFEQNIGLASADIDSALISIDGLLEIFPWEDDPAGAGLEQVQQRLTLAASNLAGDQLAATRDLETAWELLDAALAALFSEVPGTPPATTTPESTPTP